MFLIELMRTYHHCCNLDQGTLLSEQPRRKDLYTYPRTLGTNANQDRPRIAHASLARDETSLHSQLYLHHRGIKLTTKKIDVTTVLISSLPARNISQNLSKLPV